MPKRRKAAVAHLSRRNTQPRTLEEAHEREVSLGVLADMRRERLALTKAARARGIDPSIAKRYVGSALRRTASGRYEATPFDRLPREVSVLTPQGPVWVTVRDSRTASRIGEHRAKAKEWRRTRDPVVLKPFEGCSFRSAGVTHRFVTDPDTLIQLDDADLLALESLYRSVQAGTSV
jgi:hypothetical protein